VISRAYTVDYGNAAFSGACAAFANRNSLSCSAGAARFCSSKGFATGFPQQTSMTQMSVLCVSPPATGVANVDIATLAAHVSTCTTSNLYSLACEAACDDYCTGMGYAAGFGPTESNGNLMSVACLPPVVGKEIVVPISTFQGGCSVNRNDVCDAAAANYCTAHGYAGGFGPLQASSANAQAILVCVP
jgi:hypothetical protein